jgi:hypothetical protein
MYIVYSNTIVIIGVQLKNALSDWARKAGGLTNNITNLDLSGMEGARI